MAWTDPAPRPSWLVRARRWTLASLVTVVALLSVLVGGVMGATQDALQGLAAPLLITAVSTVVIVLTTGSPLRSLMASGVAAAATLASMAAIVLCGADVPGGHSAVAASVALLLAQGLALLPNDPGSSAPLPRRSLGPSSRFISMCAACAGATSLPPLATCTLADPGVGTFSVLSCSSVALTALLMGGIAPLLPGSDPAPRAGFVRVPAWLLDRVFPPLLALASATLVLHGGPGLARSLPLGAWAAVSAASAAMLLLLLTDLALALAVAGPSVLVSLGAAALSGITAPAPAATIAVAALIAGGSSLCLLLVLVLPGAERSHAERAVAIAVRVASSAALGLLVTTTFLPRESRALAGAAAFGFASLAALVPVVHAALFRRMLHPATTRALDPVAVHSDEHLRRFARRFRHLPPWTRFAARAKLRFDPLFPAMGSSLPLDGTVLDLGAGYGLVAAWISAARPALKITCVELSPPRAALARHVAGPDARVFVADLEDLRPSSPPAWARVRYDAVLLVDVIHHLEDIDSLFAGVLGLLSHDGVCLVRTAVIAGGKGEAEPRWLRWERAVVRSRGQRVVGYRTEEDVVRSLQRAGFGQVSTLGPSDRAERLFVARPG